MRFQIYQDKGTWRWRLIDEHGRTIADSGEGYATEAECRAGIALTKRSRTAPVES